VCPNRASRAVLTPSSGRILKERAVVIKVMTEPLGSHAALNNLLAAGIVSLVNERLWGRVFQATQVLQRLDQLPAPRHASG
jgi:hypothetical protein